MSVLKTHKTRFLFLFLFFSSSHNSETLSICPGSTILTPDFGKERKCCFVTRLRKPGARKGSQEWEGETNPQDLCFPSSVLWPFPHSSVWLILGKIVVGHSRRCLVPLRLVGRPAFLKPDFQILGARAKRSGKQNCGVLPQLYLPQLPWESRV